MADLAELVVSATASGCIYALLALSYLLVLRPTGIINFAVGEWATAGAFVAVGMLTPLGWPGLEWP
jgi:branched-chain amino acid transport system permease protein